MADKQNKHHYAVIMAGGGGTRLWPLSRRAHPKQMLRLFGDRTLFQIAYDRLAGVVENDHIFVVTVAEQVAELSQQAPDIPLEHFIVEPMPRGTASVVGLAAITLQALDSNAVMAVLTADHYVQNIVLFRIILQAGFKQAEKGDLVTLGIEPTYPATCYGYLHRGEPVSPHGGLPVYQVAQFKEKPDLDSAKSMLADGQHDWNSGMFFWRADAILGEISHWMPDLYTGLLAISAQAGHPNYEQTVRQVWQGITPETIDFGIMEKSDKTVVIPAHGLGWSDVGNWESLFDIMPSDENGNLTLHATRVDFGSSGTLVCGTGNDKLYVTMGLSDMIIVDTPDALLVCPRQETQQIRKLVDYLKTNGFEIYL